MADSIIQIGGSLPRKENSLPSAKLHNAPHSFDTESPQSILECDEKSICLDLNLIVNIKSSEEIRKESRDAIVILTHREQSHPETRENIAGQSYFNMESLNNPCIKRISVAQKLKNLDKKSQKTGSLIDNVASKTPSSNENSSNIKPICNSNISTIHSDPAGQPQETEGLTDKANTPAFPSFDIFDEQPQENIESDYNFTPPLSPTISDFTDFNNFYQEIERIDTSHSQTFTPFENSIKLDKMSVDFEESLPEAADSSDSNNCHPFAIENSSVPSTPSNKRKSFDASPSSDHENASNSYKKLKKCNDLTDNLNDSISSGSKNFSDIESVYYSDSSMDFLRL